MTNLLKMKNFAKNSLRFDEKLKKMVRKVYQNEAFSIEIRGL